MSFSEALTLLIHGHRLTREVWKNKGAHVRRVVEEKNGNPPANFIAYFDENAVVVGREWSEWTPTWADMSSMDWHALPS